MELVRVLTDLVIGRGGHLSRAENRLVMSPERAFNVNDEHGRFLAQRLERQARLEAGAGTNVVEVRELQRRHDEDRAAWRRREDEMAARILEMQNQLEDMRLQQQQQMQQQVPQPQQLPPPQPPPPIPPPQQQVQPPPPQQLQPPPPQQPQQPQMMPPPFNPFFPPPPLFNIYPPAVQQPRNQGPPVGAPADWHLPQPPQVPRQRNLTTPVGARTPRGFTPRRRAHGDDDDQDEQQFDRIDRRGLKLKTFKGKDIEAWKSLFEDFATQFRWTPLEKKLHLKANVDDSIRHMFTGMDPETTAEEMMARLVSRYGVNMTSTEVENKLLNIERKPGEDLYSLADRVRSLAHRAQFIDVKRNILMRQTFFTALRGNSELQHFVNRYDDPARPDINNTLDIAIEWERRHGTATKTEKVRQVNASSDGWTDLTQPESEDDTDESDIINKISYVPIKEMKTENERQTGTTE